MNFFEPYKLPSTLLIFVAYGEKILINQITLEYMHLNQFYYVLFCYVSLLKSEFQTCLFTFYNYVCPLCPSPLFLDELLVMEMPSETLQTS